MAKLELSQQKLNSVKKAEEYYNALRTNVQLSGNNLKVIAVTSVDPSEGKSTTSTNIAWAFARAGYKTLLVDADIRNSVMSGVFKSRERITGLTDYLAGTQDLSNGLCETNVDNLFVIESGVASPNPTALLQSDNFEIMIETLRKYFDYIIVDTAPIGVVIDAAIVVQKCDASILVVEAGVAKRREVQKAKSQLEQTGKPFLGVVLNKFDIQREKYGNQLPSSAQYQCGNNRDLGWVVHGLWPQNANALSVTEHPRFCKGDLPALPKDLLARYLAISPGEQLLQGEWEKHGSCAFDSAQQYFAKEQELFSSLKLPNQHLSRNELFRWMKQHNPQLKNAYLGASRNELFICYDKKWQVINCQSK